MFVADTIPELVTKIKADANKLAQILRPIFILKQHTWSFADGLKVPTIEQIETMIVDLADELSEDNKESSCGGIDIRFHRTEDFVDSFYIGEVFYVPVYDSFK